MSVVNVCLIIFLILVAGFFSSSETSFLSLSELKLRSMVEQQRRGAKVVEKLKSNMDRLLTTILIGTNLVNSFTSAFITAITIGIFGPGSVKIAPFIVAFIMTTFGQIIPKTAAGIHPERFALLWAVPLKTLEIIFFPIVRIFEGISVAVVRIVEKVIKPDGDAITEDELKTLIDIGEKEGTIEKDESYMLNKLINFNDLTARHIMKSCSEVSMVSIDSTKDDVVQEFMKSGFSTLAVYKENRQNIVGVVNYKQILCNTENSWPIDEVLFVPESISVLELLNNFRKNAHKFAVVQNRYTQALGIVTMEDIMHVVFGRMISED